MKRCICNICSRTTSAAPLRWQLVELTLKYANFEAKFRYQNQIGTPMIVGQNLDIFHIFNIYSFESRPAKRVAPVVIFNSYGSLRPRFFPCIYIAFVSSKLSNKYDYLKKYPADLKSKNCIFAAWKRTDRRK